MQHHRNNLQQGIRARQQSRDGDCGNVCPETSLAPSDLKHAQSPKSILSTGLNFCMRSTGWEQQVLQLLLDLSSARARSLGAARRAHGPPICPASRIRAAEMPGGARPPGERAHVCVAWTARAPAPPTPALAPGGCVIGSRGRQLLPGLPLPSGLGCSRESQQICSLKKGPPGDSLIVWERLPSKLQKMPFLTPSPASRITSDTGTTPE